MKIDPTEFPKDHPMSAALRLVSRYWFLCYSKLMSLEWVWDDRYPYAATDGEKLFISRKGLDKLCKHPTPVGVLAFLLVHEALHALLGHGWRVARFTNKERANIAADYIINAMIHFRNREIGKPVFPLLEGVLIDTKLSGDKSVEQLYRELNNPQQKQQTPQTQDDTNPDSGTDESGDRAMQPDRGTGDRDDETERQPDNAGDSDSSDSDDDDADSGGCNSGDTTDSGDDPLDLSDFVGTGADDNVEPQAGEGESAQDVIDRIEEDNDRLLVSDRIESKSMGSTGQTGSRVASQRIDSTRLDWSDMLREWMNKRAKQGWESPFNAPIYLSTGLVCAGRRSRKAGTIVFAIDSSGSVSDSTYTKFLLQAQSVMDELNPEQMVLLSVSHRVADSVVLESGDMVPARLDGGGGTSFRPAFDWLKSNDVEPDVMVYLTDGWSDDLPRLEQPDFPLLWLSTHRQAADFRIGEVLEITEL
jgi:predicted metal-dependent peptidase